MTSLSIFVFDHFEALGLGVCFDVHGTDFLVSDALTQ